MNRSVFGLSRPGRTMDLKWLYVMKSSGMEYVLIQTEFLTLEEAKLNDVKVSCS